jgi:hypothetical protein
MEEDDGDVLYSAHHACIQNVLMLNKITKPELTQYLTIPVYILNRYTIQSLENVDVSINEHGIV